MTSDPVLQTQTVLIGFQVLISGAQAAIYMYQARLMSQTKKLTQTISSDQKAFQVALSKPALTVSAEWSAANPSPDVLPYFGVRATSCGAGPAKILTIKYAVDGREISVHWPADTAKVARELAGERVAHCAGRTIGGDFWLGPGMQETVFSFTMRGAVGVHELEGMARRLEVWIEYGSVFPEEPSIRAGVH